MVTQLNGADMFIIIDPESWGVGEITLSGEREWQDDFKLASIRDLQNEINVELRKYEVGIEATIEPWDGVLRVQEGLVK